jgi:hypothetical protein
MPAIAILATLVAACATGPSATPGTTGGPTSAPTPTATPVIDGIQHPTGATDVILRMETSGGFIPAEFMATFAPSFTLYGDGTVVFRDPTATPPESADGLNRSVPFLTIRLGEEAIQQLLTDAIGPGGLGIAVGPYIGLGADIPTTTFTITADGRTKSVSVVGLSPDMHPQNAPIVTALANLAGRLDGFGGAVSAEEPYVPVAYRGVISSIDQANGAVVAWPWTTIQPADFAKGPGPNDFLLIHTLTPADVTALGIDNANGGLQGLTLRSAGKLYSFALRPLLPDETR